jgi:hypothetical protein
MKQAARHWQRQIVYILINGINRPFDVRELAITDGY